MAIARLGRLEAIAMEIEDPKAMIAPMIVQPDLTVRTGSRALRNQPNQLNRS